MTTTIGIDPHKASHTAVAIDNTECVLDEIRVRASTEQTDQLRTWAAGFPDRVWAIESARGLGYLLAQQLKGLIRVTSIARTEIAGLGDGDNFVSAGNGNDSVLTRSGMDVLNLGNGDDTASAGAGDDRVNAGSGFDIVDAGDGTDTCYGEESATSCEL